AGDVTMRSIEASLKAAAQGGGQVIEELGGEGDSAAREFENLGNYLLSTGGSPEALMRTIGFSTRRPRMAQPPLAQKVEPTFGKPVVPEIPPLMEPPVVAPALTATDALPKPAPVIG